MFISGSSMSWQLSERHKTFLHLAFGINTVSSQDESFGAEMSSAEESQDPEVVLGVERRYAVDTAALLGGNEYLVYQLLDKLSQTPYGSEEREAIVWALSRAASADLTAHVRAHLEASEEVSLKTLIDFFREEHRERLPRILATALLYCGRYEDTVILQSAAHANHRLIIISIHHYAGVELPIGFLPAPDDGQTECARIGILYFKRPDGEELPPVHASANELTVPQVNKSVARKISASLALERKMLSIIDVFAVLPLP